MAGKSIVDVEKIKSELLAAEEQKLRQQYPDDDAWRAPRNIADSMGCVGCAQTMFENFTRKLSRMTDTEIIEMYQQKQ